jgi:hypothetical protein
MTTPVLLEEFTYLHSLTSLTERGRCHCRPCQFWFAIFELTRNAAGALRMRCDFEQRLESVVLRIEMVRDCFEEQEKGLASKIASDWDY